jgi:branched-chain amino acid transport system ATP-binding protein
MFRTTGLTKRFGGLTAVDDVNFELNENELCSLIGPNGAGKTTFFNLLTGTLSPSAGTIEFHTDEDWIDITQTSPDQTARLGIHRSYQITNIFPSSTVYENIRIASQAHGNHSAKFWRNVNQFEEHAEETHAILERVGLTDEADVVAKNLDHGAKRQLEVAIALAGDPDVLLLDEPNAGVSSESVSEVIDLIEDVATDHAVLLVEHNMDIVMNVSDRIVVLHQGTVIADGPPEEVRDDSAVQEAYLGGYKPEMEANETDTDSNDTDTGPQEETA